MTTLNQAGFRRPHLICNATDAGAVDFIVRLDRTVAFRGRKPGKANEAKWLVISRQQAAAIIRMLRGAPTNTALHERWSTNYDLSHPFYRRGLLAK